MLKENSKLFASPTEEQEALDRWVRGACTPREVAHLRHRVETDPELYEQLQVSKMLHYVFTARKTDVERILDRLDYQDDEQTRPLPNPAQPPGDAPAPRSLAPHDRSKPRKRTAPRRKSTH